MQHILEHNLTSKSFISDVLLVFGGYGLIHVLCQDFGLRTGIYQRNLVQTEPIRFILCFSAVYALFRNYTIAFYGTIIYYILKYVYSRGITADRCTPDLEFIQIDDKGIIIPEDTGIPTDRSQQCSITKKKSKKLKHD
jgi:hypothetical protein